MTPSAGRAAWVYKRDGRLVPFEPDKISRALFTATEGLGRPNAFLARELTDAVLHFLTAEAEGTIPTTAQVADLVVKVVREMGQPALAETFADHARHRARDRQAPAARPAPVPPEVVFRFNPEESAEQVARACLRAYSLQAVYSRDLAAAQADGLITLTGLEAPLQLGGCVLEPTGDLLEAIEQARTWAGRWLAIDGPEHDPADPDGDVSRWAGGYARELGLGLRAAGLGAVINLNSAVPPAWADQLAEGPLFAGHRHSLSAEKRAARAAALLDALLPPGNGSPFVRVDWHLGEADFAPGAAGTLSRLARLGLERPGLMFTFDRPRKPVALAESLDRRHAAVLLTVGLHLPRLAELPGLRSDPELFLKKLGSLARLGLSAAARKRDFLRRRHPDGSPIHRGFRLDRARLVAVPVGLEAVVRTLTGGGICTSRSALELARRVVQRLRDLLRQDGPTYQLDACLGGARGFALEERLTEPEAVAGVTPWDAAAPLKNQLRAAGSLHAAAEAGTVALVIPEDRPVSAEEAADLLRFAGRQTEVVRLGFVRLPAAGRQLTAPWGEGKP